MVQALAFAELLAGGVLFLAGLTGHTPAEVLKGETRPWQGLKASGSSGSSASSTREPVEGPEPNTGGLTAPPIGSFNGAQTKLEKQFPGGVREAEEYLKQREAYEHREAALPPLTPAGAFEEPYRKFYEKLKQKK